MLGLLLGVALAASPAPSALLADGLSAFAAGDIATARRDFTRLADRGSAIGETMLGTLHADGRGTVRDPAAAAGYYFRAAQRGYPPAQLALARALIRGAGVTRDVAAARVWLGLAAARGDARTVAAARREAAAIGTDPGAAAAIADWRPWPGGED